MARPPLLPGLDSAGTVPVAQGPAGPQGPQGERGPQGPPGTGGSGASNRIDITASPYNCVADGTASNYFTATDNKAGIIAALAACATSGAELYIPGNTLGYTFRCYFNDVVTGTAGSGYIGLTYPNVRIVGDGWNRSIIEGVSDRRTPRGQIASIVGNVITCVTKSDATRFKAQCRIHASTASDGTGLRSESANCNVTVAGNGTSGAFTVADVSLISGLAVGDYLYVDYGCAVFKHVQGSDAATVAYDLTVSDVEIRGEWYGSTLDGSGSNDPTKDTNNHGIYLEPRAGATTPWHTLMFDRVKVSGSYNGITVSSGGNGSHARTKLRLRDCDVQAGVLGVFMSTNTDWAEKLYSAENCYFHDTNSTVGSHLNYINAQVSVQHVACHYDNWRAGKYAFQHWGSASLQPHAASFVGCWFGAGGLGSGILTNEHSTCIVTNTHFESVQAMEIRCSTTVTGAYVMQTGGQVSFLTYADCQSGAHITLDGVVFNAINIGLTAGTIGVAIDHPVTVDMRGCKSISLTQDQGTSSVPVSVNAGSLLAVRAGSAGGFVSMRDCVMTHDIANANSQAVLAHLGAAGAAVRLENCRYIGRAPTVGAIRVDGRTVGEVEIMMCDLNNAVSSGRAIFGSATTGVDLVSGWGNRLHGTAGKGCTFSTNKQRLRFRQDSGPDIASASSITWDPDYDFARVTGTTTVDSIVLPGTSALLGFHGAVLTIMARDGFSTSTSGNIAAVYSPAAGDMLMLRYDAVTSKFVKIGG